MNEQDLIRRVEELNGFITLEDGYVYYDTGPKGAISAWQLRAIADELDRRNAEWDEQVSKALQHNQDT